MKRINMEWATARAAREERAPSPGFSPLGPAARRLISKNLQAAFGPPTAADAPSEIDRLISALDLTMQRR